MPSVRRILVLTVFESFAVVLIERGVYFFTHEALGFTDIENLWLALGFGAAYVTGALASHGFSVRLAERTVLVAAVLGQVATEAVIFAVPTVAVVVAGSVLLGFLNGLKWPVVESYLSAGQTPRQAVRTVGRFNLAWSGAVAPALVVAGPVIAWHAPALFLLAGGVNLATVLLAWPLARRPVHLPEDHPERPKPGEMARIGALLASARWSMIAGYSLMWVLAALMPDVFAGLGYGVRWATALSSVLDVVRFAAFAVLTAWPGWHGRGGPLAAVVFALPAGFFMVLYGPNLATVLVGEMVFGAAAGMTYYAALYYALVAKNAAVEAGGGHEGLIGAGFAIGPTAGLVGRGLGPVVGGRVVGMLAGLGPLVVLCAAGALRSLVRLGRDARRETPP